MLRDDKKREGNFETAAKEIETRKEPARSLLRRLYPPTYSAARVEVRRSLITLQILRWPPPQPENDPSPFLLSPSLLFLSAYMYDVCM